METIYLPQQNPPQGFAPAPTLLNMQAPTQGYVVQQSAQPPAATSFVAAGQQQNSPMIMFFTPSPQPAVTLVPPQNTLNTSGSGSGIAQSAFPSNAVVYVVPSGVSSPHSSMSSSSPYGGHSSSAVAVPVQPQLSPLHIQQQPVQSPQMGAVQYVSQSPNGSSYTIPDSSICKDHLAGKCTRKHCRFIHLPNNMRPFPDEVCKDYVRGRCARPSCRFFHGTQEQLQHLRRAHGTNPPIVMLPTYSGTPPLTDAPPAAEGTVEKIELKQEPH